MKCCPKLGPSVADHLWLILGASTPKRRSCLTVVMCRYASLFNSYVGLLSAAEDSRPLLLIGMGARGMGPLRAALEWTPVQAHATANPVTLFYITQCQQTAAYLADWDQWREAGVCALRSHNFSMCIINKQIFKVTDVIGNRLHPHPLHNSLQPDITTSPPDTKIN